MTDYRRTSGRLPDPSSHTSTFGMVLLQHGLPAFPGYNPVWHSGTNPSQTCIFPAWWRVQWWSQIHHPVQSSHNPAPWRWCRHPSCLDRTAASGRLGTSEALHQSCLSVQGRLPQSVPHRGGSILWFPQFLPLSASAGCQRVHLILWCYYPSCLPWSSDQWVGWASHHSCSGGSARTDWKTANRDGLWQWSSHWLLWGWSPAKWPSG